jgi:hypothetical protein
MFCVGYDDCVLRAGPISARRCRIGFPAAPVPQGELLALMESAAAESLDGKRLDGKHLGKTRCST